MVKPAGLMKGEQEQKLSHRAIPESGLGIVMHTTTGGAGDSFQEPTGARNLIVTPHVLLEGIRMPMSPWLYDSYTPRYQDQASLWRNHGSVNTRMKGTHEGDCMAVVL